MDIKDLKIDFKELEEDVERNRQSRLAFVKWYAEWLKKTPNKVWSKMQRDFIEKTQ